MTSKYIYYLLLFYCYTVTLQAQNKVVEIGQITDTILVKMGETIQFETNTQSTDFQWDFGNGNVETAHLNPQYTYQEKGVYTVKFKQAEVTQTMYLKVVSPTVEFSTRVLLQAVLINDGSNTMRDDLRAKNLLPLTEPYTALSNYTHIGGGGETINASFLTDKGNDSVVDWLFLELRSPSDSSKVLATQAVLLEKDGDVINTQGDAAIVFPAFPSDSLYYVAIRHRNHLGIMIAEPETLDEVEATIDFIDVDTEIDLWGNQASVDVNGVNAMWSGDTNGDGRIIFQGTSNDPNNVFFEVLSSPSNTLLQISYIAEGYTNNDINMDGQSIYQGNGNDPNIVFFNVLQHGGNTSFIPTFIIEEQLP